MSLEEVSHSDNLHDIISKLTNVQFTQKTRSTSKNAPTTNDATTLQNEALLQILKSLQSLEGKATNHQASLDRANNEIENLKRELSSSQTLINEQKEVISTLQRDYVRLKNRLCDTETANRSSKIMLSGPMLRINNNKSPAQLRDDALKNIKTTMILTFQLLL